jgi:hypothetical protein
MLAEADRKRAMAVEAIVDGLPPIERTSVYHFHLDAAFQVPIPGQRAELAYAKAQLVIKAGLKRRGIV